MRKDNTELGIKKMTDDKIKQLQKARDTMCIVYGILYKQMLKLQTEIRKTGVEANITTGGLQIYANYQDARVVRVCKKYKTVAEPGVSRYVEKAVLGITKSIVDPESMLKDNTE